MLDEKDLLAIAQLMDQKLTQQKKDLLDEMALQKKDILDEMDRRMARQKTDILREAAHSMKVLLDAEVKPQFNLLAEELSIIQEKMLPESRLESVEDDVDLLKIAVRQHSQDIRDLKKAQ